MKRLNQIGLNKSVARVVTAENRNPFPVRIPFNVTLPVISYLKYAD